MSEVIEDVRTEWDVSAEAEKLHRDALVWDNTFPWGDSGRHDLKMRTIPRMVASGYNVTSLTIAGDPHNMDEAVHNIAKNRNFFKASPDKFVLVETADDVVRAKKEDKLAIVFHFQGTNPCEGDPDMIELYYKLGIRHMLLVTNMKNVIGDGCKERTDGGLTRLGVTFIEEMNRVGMISDGSHTGYRTTMDMFEMTNVPAVFSHANPRGVFDHPRNITDDQIKACAKTGGVIGINGVGVFLGKNDNSTETFLKHLNYVVELVGPQHVGLATDNMYDPASSSPTTRHPPHPGDVPWSDIKYVDPEQFPEITDGLIKRGYSDADIRGILGENWLRVARAVWK